MGVEGELVELKAGSEIDRMVAAQVMGISCTCLPGGGAASGCGLHGALRHYSSDPAAAMDVVAKAGARFCLDPEDEPCGFYLQWDGARLWEVWLARDRIGPLATTSETIFPMAVCKAALIAAHRKSR